MAPPPSPDTPLPERLLKLAQTLQFAWFAGHLALIISVFRYAFSWISMNYYSRLGQFTYRLTFISAIATYGIVIYKTWRARQKTNAKQPVPLGYLADENIQYLLLALVWLFMPQYSIAMLPYAIYSVFHVATYTRTNLIPAMSPPKAITPAGTSPGGKQQYAQHPVAEAIGNFVKRYYDSSMQMVAGLETLLWFRVALAAILFQRRSWIILVVYTAFLRARYAQSAHVQNSFSNLEARGDNLVGNQGTPPVMRQGWDGVKVASRQFYAFTDLNRYMQGAAAPKKSS